MVRQTTWWGSLLMSKSFILTNRYNPESSFTLGVDARFLDILELLHIDVSELNQEELETFLGTLSILHPEITVKSTPPSSYMLRYQ